MDCPGNPNHYYSCFREGFDPPATEFQVSDYLVLDDGFVEDESSSQSMASSEQVPGGSPTGYSGATSRNNGIKCKNGVKKNKIEGGHRVAFRTKSELENDYFDFISSLDFHRNYYKCSSGGCDVKKIVERDREDSTFVITTYDGVHNHESPCTVYYNYNYNQMPVGVPHAWTLQDSSPHSSSSS
ncbi:WRKY TRANSCRIPTION FACTOR 51-RELATED [Salix purpurea]|uniref:WRKY TRANSCRIPTION FACTOR 51-RELATED n=1 Tax=Salix purpurea TaxID=77065 RepID=A0A9Q1AL07_SALPP|nr:WRKY TRANSCRIPTION FACTOR 51-RELATED [Salix purpurea]